MLKGKKKGKTGGATAHFGSSAAIEKFMSRQGFSSPVS